MTISYYYLAVGYLSNSLGRSRAGGDDVGISSAPASPVLLGWPVYSLLGGGGSVDGGHQAILDAKVLMNHLRTPET